MRGLRWARRLLAFLLCCLALGAAEVLAAGSRVVTRDELRARGVTLKRTRHDTPGASLAIEARIAPRETEETYVATECRVLVEAVSSDQLTSVDENRSETALFARTTRTEKRDPGLLVLGKEVERAYLVFEFRALKPAADPGARRYLLPVTTLMPKTETE